jgi:hypothetical protein
LILRRALGSLCLSEAPKKHEGPFVFRLGRRSHLGRALTAHAAVRKLLFATTEQF